MKIFFVILSLLITLSLQAQIIPDSAQPFQFQNVATDLVGAKFIFKFQLPSNQDNFKLPNVPSQGVGFQQFFLVQFPQYTALFDGTVKHSCALTSGTTTYSLTAVAAATSDINSLYCRNDDTVNAISGGASYTLTITLTADNTSFKAGSRAVSLYTTTNVHLTDKIIIDSAPNFAIMGYYGSYSGFINASSNSYIDITYTNSSSNQNYPGANIPLSTTLNINSYIQWSDFIVAFRYDKTAFDEATLAAKITKVNDADVWPASPTIQNLYLKDNDNTKVVYLAGFEGTETVKGKSFKLDFQGLKAKLTYVSSSLAVEMFVYYRNTYSVVNYKPLTFSIIATPFQLAYEHIDGPDHEIFLGGAFPIKFTLTSSATMAFTNVFVVVRQSRSSNTNNTQNSIVTFVAPSCDFSTTLGVNNKFAQRYNCYPISYTRDSTGATDGSGVFFFVPSFSSSTSLVFSVWVFFDQCGAIDVGANVVASTNNHLWTAEHKASVNFISYLYSNIDTTKHGSERFIARNLVASGTSSNPIDCFNNFSGLTNIDGVNNLPSFNDDQAASTYANAASPATTDVDRLLYKEVSNWSAFAWTSNTAYPHAAGALNSAYTVANSRNFYATNKLTSSDFILVFAHQKNNAALQPNQSFPVGLIKIAGGFFGPHQNSRLIVRYSKGYTKIGANTTLTTCYTGWGFADDKVTTILVSAGLTFTGAAAVDKQPQQFLTSIATATAKTLDTTLTNDFTIVSTVMNVWTTDVIAAAGAPQWSWGYKGVTDAAPTALSTDNCFLWGDSCHTWIPPTNNITSIYSSLEILFVVKFMQTGSITPRPVRAMRLIKLFPEAGGIWNDFPLAKVSGTDASQTFVNHMAYNKDDSLFGVCLIEVSKNFKANKIATGASFNTMVLWIFGGSLLETDYNSPASEYPVGNTPGKIYALTNGLSFQSQNPYAKNHAAGNDITMASIAYFFGTNATASWALSYSNYIFYMGSMLVFNGVSQTSITTDDTKPQLIPYYCPWYSLTTAPGAFHARGANFFPIFTAIFITGNQSYSDWGNAGVTQFLTKYNNPNYQIHLSTATQKTTPFPPIAIKIITVRFSPFDSDPTVQVNSTIDVFLIKNTQAVAVSTLTAAIYFLSSKIPATNLSSQSAPALITPTGTLYQFKDSTASTRTYNFYSYGKNWSNGFLGVFDAALTAGSTGAWISIYSRFRPTSDKYLISSTGSTYKPVDLLAFYGLSSDAGTNLFLTNYDILGPSYLLDFNADRALFIPGALTISVPQMASDVSANYKFTFSAPTNKPIPIGTNINFSTSLTVGGCGIKINNFATNCTPNSTNMSCPVRQANLNLFEIHCWNVSTSTSTLSVTLVDVSYVIDSSATNLGFTSASILVNSSTTPMTANISAVSAAPIPSLKHVISTTQAVNEGAIGKIWLEVNFGREIVRSSTITVTFADLSNLILTTGSLNPRCYPTVTTPGQTANLADGDVLIQHCRINTADNSITIQTRAITYTTTPAFKNVLYILLWPVLITNSVNKTYSIKTSSPAFTVDATNVTLKNTPDNFDAGKIKASLFSSDLCPVTTSVIFPGLIADYTFSLNLKDTQTQIGTNIINAASIFFPYNSFGSKILNVVCYRDTGFLNCIFNEEGILDISFGQQVSNSGNVNVIVTGIPNPPTADSSITFGCTLNSIIEDKNAKTKITVISGWGRLTTLKEYSSATNSSLRFLKVNTPVAYTSLRDLTTQVFKISWDLSNSYVAPSALKDPMLLIDFPREYALWKFTSSISVDIKEYFSSDNNVLPTSSTQIISGLSVSGKGNRLTIPINGNFPVTVTPSIFQYWEIKLTNLPAPSDQIASPSYTGGYVFTILSKTGDSYFSTATNFNNHYTVQNADASNTYLQWYIGNKFNYETQLNIATVPTIRYFVSIKSNVFDNYLIVQIGRYALASIGIVKPAPTILNPAVTIISLSDTIFKTTLPSYSYASAYNQDIPFYIGCQCSTFPGVYLANFKSSDSVNFAVMAPVFILAQYNSNSKGTITVVTPPINIPKGSSFWIKYYLSEPNVDSLAIEWTKDVTADSTANILPITIPEKTIAIQTEGNSPIFSYFTISSVDGTTSTGDQKFTNVKPPNVCYALSVTSIVSTPSNTSIQAILPSVIPDTSFKFYLGNDNTKNLDKNTILVEYTPTVSPVYLYCAFICLQKTVTQADIVFKDYPESITKIKDANTLHQIFSAYIPPLTTSVVAMSFNGLVRGLSYQLKCYISSTETDVTKRNISTNKDYFTGISSGNTTTTLTATSVVVQNCAIFTFTSDPGDEARRQFIYYCQRQFSDSGYYLNGCVSCQDSEGKFKVIGLELPNKITCTSNITSSRLRFLQSNSTTPSNTSVTFSMCPVSNPVCKTDVTGKGYLGILQGIMQDLKDAKSIESKLPPGNSNIPIDTVNAPFIISDTALDIKKFKCNASGWTKAGNVKVTSSFSDTGAKCYYQILKQGGSSPTFASISSCTDTSKCFKRSFGPAGLSYEVTNPAALDVGTWDLWATCVNDIPSAVQSSLPFSCGSFTVASEVPPPTPFCNVSNVPGCIGGSSYLSLSFLVMMMALALLF